MCPGARYPPARRNWQITTCIVICSFADGRLVVSVLCSRLCIGYQLPTTNYQLPTTNGLLAVDPVCLPSIRPPPSPGGRCVGSWELRTACQPASAMAQIGRWVGDRVWPQSTLWCWCVRPRAQPSSHKLPTAMWAHDEDEVHTGNIAQSAELNGYRPSTICPSVHPSVFRHTRPGSINQSINRIHQSVNRTEWLETEWKRKELVGNQSPHAVVCSNSRPHDGEPEKKERKGKERRKSNITVSVRMQGTQNINK